MTTRRHIGGVVLAALALTAVGDGSAQGTGIADGQGASRRSDTAALQAQLFEATRRSNELAAEQNRQTQQILEQTHALADASVRQSAAAEQARQMAEASIAQNLQALEAMRAQVDQTLLAAQSRKALALKVLVFWSAVLGLFLVVAGYLVWRVHGAMRTKTAQAVDEIRSLGLAELQKVLAELKAERRVLAGDAARRKERAPDA